MKLHDILVANALIKLSPFIVGGAILFGAFACNDLSRKVDQIATPATPASTEVVEEKVATTPCEKVREELLVKADDVSQYYVNFGRGSDEYYKLRSEADALKQKALDMKCSDFDPERIRY